MELVDLPVAKATRARVWLGLAPPKVEVFCWLALFGRVLIVDNLRRKRVILEACSDLCVQEG